MLWKNRALAVKLIAGLGNPGAKYVRTRHNVGFMALDEIARRASIPLKKRGHQGVYGVGRFAGVEVTLLKPHTFMNLSGASIGSAVKSLGITPRDLLVLHDDIDLPFGTIRIKMGGGHGGQRGVRHISEVLGTRDYTRIRIGVGRPHPGQDAADYVLRPFTKEEESLLGQVLENAAGAVEVILADGEQKAMNLYHCKEVSV